ncbi:trmA [Acrasis kona]|uniref:TrmA n=1 Tax=Acrasis kona TaxID=1008807 RepID=A0AAW2YHW4_9EUKA
MNASVIALALLICMCCPLSPRDKILLERAHQFQTCQVTFNVSGLAAIFAEDSVTNIPIGTGRNVGKKEILTSFAEYFKTLNTLSQKIIGEVEINGNHLAYSKQINAFTKKECTVSYSVINWFVFNEENLIQEFSAIFNLTSVKQQSACHLFGETSRF